MAEKLSIVAYLGLKSKEFMAGLSKAKGATSSIMAKMGGYFRKFAKAVAIGMAVAATAMAAAVIKFSVDALQAFAAFEKGMLEVYTLLPGISKRNMGKMSNDVLALSREMGVLTTDMIPALYQAVSAGIPKENAIEFMRIASKGAIAGVTTLEVAVDGLTSVINAYKRTNLSAKEAADIFFTTIRLGKTTFEELAASIYVVSPVAAAVGISFADVGAAIAALTAQGVPTAQACTQIRSAILSLSAPGEKARRIAGQLGLEFDQLTKIMKEPGGLKTAMELVITATGGNMDKLKGLMRRIEGVNGLVALSSKGFQSFGDAIIAQSANLGSMEEAFKMMNQGLAREWDIFKAGIKATVIEAGEALAPIAKEFIPLVKLLADAFQRVPFDKLAAGIMKWMGEVKSELRPILDDLIMAWRELVRAAGPIFAMFGGISGRTGRLSVMIQLLFHAFVALIKIVTAASRVFVFLKKSFGEARAGTGNLALALNLAVDIFTTLRLSAVRIIGPLALMTTHFGRATKALKDFFRWAGNAAYELMDFVAGFGPAQNALYSFGYAWLKVQAMIMGVISDIVESLYNAVYEIVNTFDILWDSIASGLDGVWNRFAEVFPGLANIISKLTAGMREKFAKVFNFIKGKIEWLAKIYSKFTGDVIELEGKMATEVTRIEKAAEDERTSFRRSARSKRNKEWEAMVKKRRAGELESARITQTMEHERVMQHRRALLTMEGDEKKIRRASLTDLEDMLEAKGEAGKQAMAQTRIQNEAQLARMKKAIIALEGKRFDLSKKSGEQIRKIWLEQGQRGRNAYETLLNYEKKLAAARKAQAEAGLRNTERTRKFRSLTYEQGMKEEARLKDAATAAKAAGRRAASAKKKLDKDTAAAYAQQMKDRYSAVEEFLFRQGRLQFNVHGMEVKANNAREALEKYNHIQRLNRQGEWQDESGKVWKFELDIDKERRLAMEARQTLRGGHMAERTNALKEWQRRSAVSSKARLSQLNQLGAAGKVQLNQMNQVAAMAGKLSAGNIKIELGTPEHLGKVLATANVLLSSIDRTLKGKFINQ